MDLAEVDTYVDGVSDEVLACRERGRHIFPTIRQAGMVFVDVTDEGLLVRPLLCTCCRLARRVELWDTAGRKHSATPHRVKERAWPAEMGSPPVC
jgi:hypothetical protein